MAEYGYDYVDEFAAWQKIIVNYQNESDQSYNNLCQNIIENDTENSGKYKEICIFFTKGMDYIAKHNDFTHNIDSLNGICAYLNYYLNSELKNINNSNIKSKDFILKIKGKDISDSLKLTNCFDKIKNIDNRILDQMKYIHNLFFNAQKYVDYIKEDDTVRCYFAKECHTSYNIRRKQCNNSSTGTFCEKMKKFKNDYKNYMSHTTCGVPRVLPEFDEKPRDGLHSGVGGDNSSTVDVPIKFNSKIATHTLTTSGIVLGLSVLYKFTPLGTRISQLFQRKNNIVQNIQEQNDDNSLFNSDNLHRSSSNSNYNLTYQQS